MVLKYAVSAYLLKRNNAEAALVLDNESQTILAVIRLPTDQITFELFSLAP